MMAVSIAWIELHHTMQALISRMITPFGVMLLELNLVYYRYTLGLILDSTGFAKPKVHAEGVGLGKAAK